LSLPVFLFPEYEKNPEEAALCFRMNKYNPSYNLQTMKLYRRNAKLGAEEMR
jgi:hypothetical protein